MAHILTASCGKQGIGVFEERAKAEPYSHMIMVYVDKADPAFYGAALIWIEEGNPARVYSLSSRRTHFGHDIPDFKQ